MGEIADDHMGYIADDMEAMENDPDHPSWDYRPSHFVDYRRRCMHRFVFGQCPNAGCPGSNKPAITADLPF